MPATLDELATGLQQFFATRFPLDGDDGPGSVLLVFDNLGRPLAPQEFAGSGTDAARDLLSHQRAADLADQLPAGNALKRGWYLPRGGSRLSRWYANVLRGSAGPPVSAGETDLAAFEAAKASALRQLDLNRLVAVSGTAAAGPGGTVAASGTFDTYYATSMSPPDWFDEGSTSWNTYQIAAGDRPAPVAPTAGPVAAPRFSFMVAEDPNLPEIVRYVQYATATEPDPPDQPDPTWSLLQDNGLLTRLGSSGVKDDLLVAGKARVDPTIFRMDTMAATPLLDRTLAAHTHLDAAFASQAAVPAVVDAITPTAATSGDFAVQFEYCLVRLDRPWWDDTFLHRHDWRLPGYEPGQISTGSAADPTGEITLITIGMLVIRNLSITASWSPADLAALPRSTSLGPFCIAAGNFDQASGTLTRKGMQAAAWLCLVPTKMPGA